MRGDLKDWSMSTKASTKKKCFVVSQIGEDGTPERIGADWFLDGIVKPTFIEFFSEYHVERADEISTPGMIDAQVITRIINYDLVIADLTNLNPNVFYEIGLRHMAQKPIIHMHEVGCKIPFDVNLYRSIKYSRITPASIVDARTALKRAIEEIASADHTVDNPVSRAIGKVNFEQHAIPKDRIISTQLTALGERISELENTISSSSLDQTYDFIIRKNREMELIAHSLAGPRAEFAGPIRVEFHTQHPMTGDGLLSIVSKALDFYKVDHAVNAKSDRRLTAGLFNALY